MSQVQTEKPVTRSSDQVQVPPMSGKPTDDIVRLPKEVFTQSDVDIKKAAKDLVFKKFSGLLKNLA